MLRGVGGNLRHQIDFERALIRVEHTETANSLGYLSGIF